jgi:hypothetical protein
MIKSVPLNQQGAPCLKECQVAIDLDWQVQIRKIGALANASTWRLRVAEVDQARLPQRVYRNDLGAASLGLLERRQHPRMIGPRILTGQDQQLGVVDIVQGNAGLTDPDGLCQRVAGRLVAHVGAVRQIVGAVCPYEQLIAERRLI